MADNMKPYELGITAHACLQLEKILAGIVRQLIQRRLIGEEFRFIDLQLNRLFYNPYIGSKRCTGRHKYQDYWQLRVGQYIVIYKILEPCKRVDIIHIERELI